MKIHCIFTGGTIDSYYEGSQDTAVPAKHSVVPRYLKNLKLYDQFQYTELCMKDSRAINDADRKKLVRIITRSKANYILVTHGTYTMPDSARFVERHLPKNQTKIIIFTGAMIPLDGFTFSDGGFNLGYTISQFHCAAPGVYVAMNGKLFPAKTSTKIIAQGRFAEIQ
ncbi:MAG TPA: asparaginase [Candidatus Kerfeldbacteria bacterium]|nr:asparaginase [Candidatus Kerfeldbacteria bacterium]